MFKLFINRWNYFMRWVQIIKILVKHAKLISRDLKKEGSSKDADSPGILTKDEIGEVITDHLLNAIPELIKLYERKKK